MGRVVSRTFGTIGRNAVSFFILAVFAVVPQVVLGAVLGVGNAVRQPVGMSHLGHMYSMLGIVSLVSMVFGSVLQAALVHGTVSDLNGQKASFGDCLQTGLRTCLPVIGLSIVMSVALVFGFVLLIVPGVLMMLAWSVAVPVLVVEHTGVFGAFGRSAELTKGHRWAIFGLIIAVFIISGAISLAVTPLNAVLVLHGEGLGAMWPLLIVQGLHAVFIAMINATGTAAIYYELRSIKEGIGPEQLASVFE